MLWQIDVHPQPGQPDLDARRIAGALDDLHIGYAGAIHSARGFLLSGPLSQRDCERVARDLLCDPIIERFTISNPATAARVEPAGSGPAARVANVLLKPGVMDPVAQSTEQAIRGMGFRIDEVHTLRRYEFAAPTPPGFREQVSSKVLANDAIERVIWGELHMDHLAQAAAYQFRLVRVPMRGLNDTELERLSRDGQLSLSLAEMRTIQAYFGEQSRDPTDVELETLAQTWSEHCSHKTLKGEIDYEERSAAGEVTRRLHFANLLKETVFQATETIRRQLGPDRDWCVSVFADNAGIVRFDDRFNVCFKVETHNHPSAIEPYGGANTGMGGVIRDVLGTGLGARPLANTDVFCFAPPDFPVDGLPPGVLHPKRVMKGVVSGVRDYGNRMGIPTINGAIYFDERYLGNPLVFCGTVGLIPREWSHKEPKPNDLIVTIGGRTGRDGIHGATFSSVELTHESDELSGGAVQIGNAITEKMMLDVILAARDRGLYHAITDCGAGGFSSAVGEMGEEIGAEVWLDRAPLKYQGLSYTEIWISEAQERMVLAVPEDRWPELQQLAAGEGVEATVIGRFVPTGRLVLKYKDHVVGDLDMRFLHKGRPPVVRTAVYKRVESGEWRVERQTQGSDDAGPAIPTQSKIENLKSKIQNPPATPFNEIVRRILSSWNACSKEWVIRQYDHEVQGASVVKPLVGAANDGPSDAAVIRPVLGSYRGLAIACGMNPRYGDLDPYWMAASAIDEAVRNCVAVGADPERIAILDNFCWGNTDRPDELGKLVRAALACRDIAVAYGTPFVSGKDSLNNEFKVKAGNGGPIAKSRKTDDRIVIPPTLLISALGQIDDVRRCVTMDLKEMGNPVYLVGVTRDEMGGSHYNLVEALSAGTLPILDADASSCVFRAMHAAISRGLVRACHDLSEGGLAMAAAEMAFAGGLGLDVDLDAVPCGAPIPSEVRAGGTAPAAGPLPAAVRLFSESNTRFLVEVSAACGAEFEACIAAAAQKSGGTGAVPLARIGAVSVEPVLRVRDRSGTLIATPLAELKECWQRPLRW